MVSLVAANFSDNINIQDRAYTAQDFIEYAGSNPALSNTGKSYLGALIKDLNMNGELRAPDESENIFHKRLDPTDRVRYLEWFTAMSDDVDESQKQAAEEVNGRRLRRRSTVTRVRTESNLSKPYNRAYKSKRCTNKVMPNQVMWMDKDRGPRRHGMDQLVRPELACLIHVTTPDGVEHQIAAAAVLRSEGLTKSSYPLLKMRQ